MALSMQLAKGLNSISQAIGQASSTKSLGYIGILGSFHKLRHNLTRWSGVKKGGFQLMQILVLLSMYFDAVVVFVTSHSLLFKFPLAILCVYILFLFSHVFFEQVDFSHFFFGKTCSGIADWSLLGYTTEVINKVKKYIYCLRGLKNSTRDFSRLFLVSLTPWPVNAIFGSG